MKGKEEREKAAIDPGLHALSESEVKRCFEMEKSYCRKAVGGFGLGRWRETRYMRTMLRGFDLLLGCIYKLALSSELIEKQKKLLTEK